MHARILRLDIPALQRLLEITVSNRHFTKSLDGHLIGEPVRFFCDFVV